MSEIDAIIEEIQAIAKDLSYTTSDNNDRKILQVLLRLAWQVQEHKACYQYGRQGETR